MEAIGTKGLDRYSSSAHTELSQGMALGFVGGAIGTQVLMVLLMNLGEVNW